MRREILLLEEIVTAADRAIEIAKANSPQSLESRLDARDALLWNLTIVGEAVSQLPDSFRSDHPEIPWAHPVRLRNRIVHGYWSVDLDLLHAVADHDLPSFVAKIRATSDSPLS